MLRIFKSNHCETIVEVINSCNEVPSCCGEPMRELKANTTDAAQEKHVPEVSIEGNLVKVKVGSVEHPMTEEHHIAFIYLETENGVARKDLNQRQYLHLQKAKSQLQFTSIATYTDFGRKNFNPNT